MPPQVSEYEAEQRSMEVSIQEVLTTWFTVWVILPVLQSAKGTEGYKNLTPCRPASELLSCYF